VQVVNWKEAEGEKNLVYFKVIQNYLHWRTWNTESINQCSGLRT